MRQTKKFPLPAIGVDVLSNETALANGAVRSAKNVDIDRAGRFSRRVGYTRRVTVTGMHSLYYAAQRGWALVAKHAELFRLDPITYATEPLYPLRSADLLDFTEYNGNLYFSNQTTAGWVPSDSAVARAVGVPPPNTPVLSPAPGGLSPGTYGVVLTLIDDRGEEGGATDLATITLPDGGGIRMSGLTQHPGWAMAVYITSPDGDQLRFAAEIPAVFPSYVVAENAAGGLCDTLALKPLPPGEFIRWHNGRLITARGAALYVSEPLRPHLHNPAYGVIPFSGRISLLESVGDGVYVGDSRGIWFLSGKDPVKFEQTLVSPRRAVHRSGVMVSPEHFPDKTVPATSPVAVWLSTSGYVVGAPGGTVVELQHTRMGVPLGLSGRSALLLRDGRKQVITPVNSTSTVAFGTAVDSVIS